MDSSGTVSAKTVYPENKVRLVIFGKPIMFSMITIVIMSWYIRLHRVKIKTMLCVFGTVSCGSGVIWWYFSFLHSLCSQYHIPYMRPGTKKKVFWLGRCNHFWNLTYISHWQHNWYKLFIYNIQKKHMFYKYIWTQTQSSN